VADGVRHDLGPAIADVIRDDVAGAIERDLAPSLSKAGGQLGTAVGASVEKTVNQVSDRLQQLSDHVTQDAAASAWRTAWWLGGIAAALLVLVIAIVSIGLRRNKTQLETVALLTAAIKETPSGLGRLRPAQGNNDYRP
jgi:hypothetical protein